VGKRSEESSENELGGNDRMDVVIGYEAPAMTDVPELRSGGNCGLTIRFSESLEPVYEYSDAAFWVIWGF
jgi:hypothetical protein